VNVELYEADAPNPGFSVAHHLANELPVLGSHAGDDDGVDVVDC
jgi:hypothetical protein